MSTRSEPIQHALECLREVTLAEAPLSAEFEASVGDFFGPGGPGPDPQEAPLARQRYLEWFLLERHSPTLNGTPLELLLGRSREAYPTLAEAWTALLSSSVGIFEVTEVRPGEGLWLRDLAGFGEYALSKPDGLEAAEPRDLIVGRLFPVGGGLHLASPAAGLFRDPRVLDAVERDLQRLRQDRTAKVLHLSQRELEVMFWSGSPRRQVEPAVAEAVDAARQGLLDAGLEEERVEEVLARLVAAPLSCERPVVGARDALGEVLDELAFESTVDLERARTLLAQAWIALQRGNGTAGGGGRAAQVDGSHDARNAIDAFARGRAEGGDLETLLAVLERDLGVAEGPEDDPEDGAVDGGDDGGAEEDAERPAPDFTGVVGAIVDEFLWEVGERRGGARAEELRCLGLLATFGEPLGLLEELDADQLLRFLGFWVHERRALASAREARELLEALDAFCVWAEEAQELPLRSVFAATLEGLRESLPRIVEANRLVDPQPTDDEPGGLYELRVVQDSVTLRDQAGEERAVSLAPALLEHLRHGDRLRAAVSSAGTSTVYRCYPPEAVGLIEAR